MKKWIICLLLFMAVPLWATDKQITSYTAETSPSSSDWLYLVKAAGGVGTDRKITVGNLTKGLTLANFPASANVVSLLGAADYAAFRTLLGSFDLASPGPIGGTTPNTSVFTSVTVTKSSGVSGQVQLYNDYLTEVYGAILKGPTGTMGSAYTLQYPNAAPTAGQILRYNTPMTWQNYGEGLGAATATSLTTTGIVDGKIHVEAVNGKTIDKLRARYVATGTNDFILPTPASSGGNDYCFKQATAGTNAISVAPTSSSGVMIEKPDGTAYCTANYKLVSGGANTDRLCLVAKDATHYDIFNSVGTWTCTGGSTCAVYVEGSNATTVDNYMMGSSTDDYYRGMMPFTPAGNVTVCKLTFKLSAYGTITGKSYYAEVWNTDGTNLTTKVGTTSNAVTGSNSWSETSVDFTFASPFSITTSGTYALVVYTTSGADGSNFIIMPSTAGGNFDGNNCRFNSSGTRTDYNGYDLKGIKLWTQ